MKKLYFIPLAFFTMISSLVNAQSAEESGTQVSGAHLPALSNTTVSPENNRANPFLIVYLEKNSNMVVIRWQTETELNADHFELERATDGVHFVQLDQVVAKGGADGESYQDEDNSALGLTSSYRLKVVDKAGNAFYSQSSAVDVTGRSAPAIKPTFVHMGSTLRLTTFQTQPLTVNFFNAGGNLAGSYIVNGTSFDINTSSWGKGLYFYRISDQAHPFISSGKVMVL
jgi:hypothetical protein